MSTYNWALIERLLHEVQNADDKVFTPHAYAQEHAVAMTAVGEPVGDLEELKAQAMQYEALLLERGFIEGRPGAHGVGGENFMLTLRGSSLLCLLDSSSPGNDHPLQVLDEQVDALEPALFDTLSATVQIA